MRVAVAISITLLATAPALADPQFVRTPGNAPAPRMLDGIGIEDKPGVELPQSLELTDQNGRPVRLGDYVDGKHPLILVLAYYQCPMLCSIVMNGLLEGMQALSWSAGKEYRVVSVSFDPRDGLDTAQKKRETYTRHYGRELPEKSWDFLYGPAETTHKLADTVGFHYRWDDKTHQFAHAAGIFVFTPDGRLSRTLYGIQFPARTLRLALVEASEGKLGSAWDKVVLFCYHYDPNAQGYTLAIFQVVKIVSTLFVLALGWFLLRLWRKDRSNQTPHPEHRAT